MSGATRNGPDFGSLVGQSHLVSLDGMRAVAVASVMASHYEVAPIRYGRFGVALFFVLSGFLITLLLLRERDRTARVSLRNFYVRRALRIFPAYYVFLLLSFASMVLFGMPVQGSLVLASVFYVLNYAIALHLVAAPLVAIAWSLAVEEQFYALWPATFAWFKGDRARIKRLIVVLIVAIVLWRSILVYRGVPGYVYYAFDTRFDSLLVGCGLAVCAQDAWLRRLASLVSRHPVLPIVTALLIHNSLKFGGTWNETAGYTIEALLMATLLVQAMMLGTRAPWQWLNWKPVRYVGTISYPLYLYHQLISNYVGRYGGWRSSFQLIANIVLALLVASASYRYIEQPFLRRKRRWEVVHTDS